MKSQEDPTESSSVKTEAPRSISWTSMLRWVVIAGVLVGLWFAVSRAATELSRQPMEWHRLSWWRLAAAVGCYAMTLLISGSYWRSILRGYGFAVPHIGTLRAFVCSQLGKYLPGKAMVVVIRTGMLRSLGVPFGSAVASTFIETLLWIFTGAQVASIVFLARGDLDHRLRWLALAVLAVGGIATLPPMFNGLVRLISKLRKVQGESERVRQIPLTWTGYLRGNVMLIVGWLVAGLSAWLVARSLPGATISADHYGLILAAVSLATVGGFLSLLPGGIGVRELVIIPVLAPQMGVAPALVTAILIRLCWIVAELACSVTIEALYRFQNRSVIQN